MRCDTNHRKTIESRLVLAEWDDTVEVDTVMHIDRGMCQYGRGQPIIAGSHEDLPHTITGHTNHSLPAWVNDCRDIHRSLYQMRSQCIYNASRTASTALLAGAIHPPHGDAIVAHLTTKPMSVAPRLTLAARAVYATRCQQEKRPLTADGNNDRMVVWQNRIQTWKDGFSSPVSLRAIGREQEVLLPVLQSARSTEAFVPLVLNRIDVIDVINSVGGDPREMYAVIREILNTERGSIDPQILVRLVASRRGQTMLTHRPTISPLPIGTDTNIHLCEWWERAATDATDCFYHRVTTPPPTDHDRYEWLRTSFQRRSFAQALPCIASAARTTALHDGCTTRSIQKNISTKSSETMIQWLLSYHRSA